MGEKKASRVKGLALVFMPVFACVGEIVFLLVHVLVLVIVFAGEHVFVPAPVLVLSAVRMFVLVGEPERVWGPGVGLGSNPSVRMGVGVASSAVSETMGWQTGHGPRTNT